jgi:hypothetical protein
MVKTLQDLEVKRAHRHSGDGGGIQDVHAQLGTWYDKRVTKKGF